MNNEKVQIDVVCIYKNKEEFAAKDLVENYDEYSGIYEYNEKNLTVVGYNKTGKSWLLDTDGFVIREEDVDFDDNCLLGYGYDFELAKREVDEIILAELGFFYDGALV